MKAEIRRLSTPEDVSLAVDLQRAVWGSDEVPAHVLLAAAHNGGLCAGAVADGTLAGFVWGFPGLDNRVDPPRPKHCSHQLGVHPAYRNLGLGFGLKRFQWEFVRGQGIDLITWTYDPLLATNAHLNITRLGAVCKTYRRNEYGDLNDDLNAGLPTDRFQVDLWVNSARVCEAMDGAGRRPVDVGDVEWLNPPSYDGAVLPPEAGRLDRLASAAGPLALAIPLGYQVLRVSDPGQALAWRHATRAAFEAAFDRGYTVVDFSRQASFGCYVLDRS